MHVVAQVATTLAHAMVAPAAASAAPRLVLVAVQGAVIGREGLVLEAAAASFAILHDAQPVILRKEVKEEEEEEEKRTTRRESSVRAAQRKVFFIPLILA